MWSYDCSTVGVGKFTAVGAEEPRHCSSCGGRIPSGGHMISCNDHPENSRSYELKYCELSVVELDNCCS